MNFRHTMDHVSLCEQIFKRACSVLGMSGFSFKPKEVKLGDDQVRVYKMGYTNLSTKIVVIDIYTKKLKKPKKYSSILAIIAHELAHHQQKPYREFQWKKLRWINRIHYPAFYRQVNKNVSFFKKDGYLRQFYE